MRLDVDHPLNAGIMKRGESRSNERILTRPADHVDPYYTLGSHPDVVEYLWDRIAPALEIDCRGVVLGTPALVEPKAGVVIALALGTAYAFQMVDADRNMATTIGYTHLRTSSTGESTDLREQFGPNWVFGQYNLKTEAEHLKTLIRSLEENWNR